MWLEENFPKGKVFYVVNEDNKSLFTVKLQMNLERKGGKNQQTILILYHFLQNHREHMSFLLKVCGFCSW